MKRILTSLCVLVIFLGLTGYWFVENSKPVSKEETSVDFVITKGSSALKIAQDLKNKGLIRNLLVFKFYVQLTGKANKIQAGEFRLSPSYSVKRIIEEFTKGPAEVWVTIPEGFRKEQIIEKFVNVFGKTGAEAEIFRKDFLDSSQNKEGLLFPDTYLFPKTATGGAVVKKMLSVFDQKVSPSMKEDILVSGYSLEEILTIASLVERETKTEEEKPIVSGIIHKRFKANWPLQIDATLQYALATSQCGLGMNECKWWPVITNETKEMNSKYNSYKYIGLPPTPIANPGLSSIKAAIYPKNSDYWYYIHDDNGKIYYAQTNDEHNQNIRKYLFN